LTIEFVTSYGYLGILLLVVAINLIPFASPSNLVLAGAIVYFTSMNPAIIAALVAVGATLGKLVHFCLASLLGKHISPTGRLGKYGRVVGRWGTLGAFVAAATPIPDDPVVIPLGLMRFDTAKFLVAYFFGKLAITFVGAYGVKVVEVELETLLGNQASIAGSVILSILAVTILIKADPSKIKRGISRLRARLHF